MKVRDAVREVRSGSLPVAVVLCGEADYIRSVAVRELVAAAGVSLPELNLMTYEGRPPMSALRDALGKPPFMSSSKVVILRRTDLFSVKAPAEASSPITRMELDAHTLFIVDAGEKLDRRKAAVKHLLAEGMLIECVPLKGDALVSYVVSLARKRQLHMAQSVARALAERCDEDLQTISAELDKLRFVCRGEVTAQDLDRYSRPAPEASVYRIQDLLLSGQYDAARRAVEQLLREDPAPMGFLSLTGNVLRQMLIARTCRDARFPSQKTIALIRQETGAPEWMARRAYEKCVHLPAPKLRRGLQLLAAADFGAKQGRFVLSTDLFALLFRIYAA